MRVLLNWVIALVFITGCSKPGTSYLNDPHAPAYLHNRPVGASARELLAADTYQSLQIEIMYMNGFTPDPGAVSHMQTVLGALLNKPGGITVVTREIPAGPGSTLSVNDVVQIELNNRTVFTSGSQIAVSVIYTNGNNTDANVLGVAYKNTSVVLFGKTIHDNSGGLGQASRTKLEATVLEHEIGHLLGLVDLGSAMQTNHKDAAHGNHCNNTNCLMYYASETTDILGFLITGSIPSFDTNCKADLHANGGQ